MSYQNLRSSEKYKEQVHWLEPILLGSKLNVKEKKKKVLSLHFINLIKYKILFRLVNVRFKSTSLKQHLAFQSEIHQMFQFYKLRLPQFPQE